MFEKALRELFGLKEAQLFLGAGEDGFLCMAAIPASKNSFMESRNMCLAVELRSRAFVLALQGPFGLLLCRIWSFMLTAAYPEPALWWRPLRGQGRTHSSGWSLFHRDTCLAVGFDQGPSFAMFCQSFI